MEKTALIFCYLEVSSDLDVRYRLPGNACQIYLCKLISINTHQSQCANVIQKKNCNCSKLHISQNLKKNIWKSGRCWIYSRPSSRIALLSQLTNKKSNNQKYNTNLLIVLFAINRPTEGFLIFGVSSYKSFNAGHHFLVDDHHDDGIDEALASHRLHRIGQFRHWHHKGLTSHNNPIQSIFTYDRLIWIFVISSTPKWIKGCFWGPARSWAY